MDIMIITGMSGSGKSVALHALEDAGFYCVDNLPPELLADFVALEKKHGASQVAIAMDARSGSHLATIPQQFETLKAQGHTVRSFFLDAATPVLVKRYSETRRKHPLSQNTGGSAHASARLDLVQAIDLERSLLSHIREQSHVVDTGHIRPSQLQAYVKDLTASKGGQLTLVFQSFAFKGGVPADADFMFDVRMLPNPHYEPELRALTGKDAAVATFLKGQNAVGRMENHIREFLSQWLEALEKDHRSYVTVAIGCTGGQHRSVYLAEQLAAYFSTQEWATLIRHREQVAL